MRGLFIGSRLVGIALDPLGIGKDNADSIRLPLRFDCRAVEKVRGRGDVGGSQRRCRTL
jgi:hypothetical protein